MAGQHANLSPERWARFGFGQQVLMIANEMNRGRKQAGGSDLAGLRRCYERILALVDLTVAVESRRSRRRELLRWRDLVAELFLHPGSRADHDRVFRGLLLLTPESYAQLPYVLPDR